MDKNKERCFRTAPDSCRSTAGIVVYRPTETGYLPPTISINSV